MQLREERQHEILLMSELRNVQTRHMRPTASHRLDGYTSDTTAFADDDDEFMIPLHINTKNPTSPGSTTSYNTIKANYSTINRNERPFVAVRKAHKKYEQVEYVTLGIKFRPRLPARIQDTLRINIYRPNFCRILCKPKLIKE